MTDQQERLTDVLDRIDGNLDRIEAAWARVDEYKARAESAEATVALLRGALEEARELIERIEWRGGQGECPECHGASYAMYPGEDIGHRADCALVYAKTRALAALTPLPELQEEAK